MSRKRVFYILFFVVLVLIFFGGLSLAVPGFFNQRMPPISKVEPFSFTTQEGKTFTNKDVQGKIQAVNFFFTTCKTVCPRMNNNLESVYKKFKNEPGFMVLSYTCDPTVDSVPVLKHYADSLGADPKKWVFLTGEKDSLYSMARHSYAIDDSKTPTEPLVTDFLHTQFIALVNRKGEVVKIYDGLKPSEMTEMEHDIQKLLKD